MNLPFRMILGNAACIDVSRERKIYIT